jgi:glutamate dehydrogenase (NADP+)
VVLYAGKGMSYGGSHLRPEATGFGIVYFLQELLKGSNEGDLKGRESASCCGVVLLTITSVS